MRNGLMWVVGFLLSATLVLPVLVLYSLARPSLWLPMAFAVAFFALLGFAPRVQGAIRFALALIAGSGACLLWILSGADSYYGRWRDLLEFARVWFVAAGFVGFATLAIALPQIARRSRPALGVYFILIFLGWGIAYFSSSAGGASPMIDWVVNSLGVDRKTAEVLIVIARKIAHFCFYAIVAICGYVGSLRNDAPRKQWMLAGLMTALAYAAFDEIRQSTMVDRGGSAWDVALDMAGATAAMIAVRLIAKPNKAGRPSPAKN